MKLYFATILLIATYFQLCTTNSHDLENISANKRNEHFLNDDITDGQIEDASMEDVLTNLRENWNYPLKYLQKRGYTGKISELDDAATDLSLKSENSTDTTITTTQANIDNTTSTETSIVSKIKKIWNKITHPGGNKDGNYSSSTVDLYDALNDFLSESKYPRSVPIDCSQCFNCTHSVTHSPNPSDNNKTITSATTTIAPLNTSKSNQPAMHLSELNQFQPADLEFLRKFIHCLKTKSDLLNEAVKPLKVPTNTSNVTSASSVINKQKTDIKSLNNSTPIKSGNHFDNKLKFLAHLHHPVYEIGKKSYRRLDLNEVQKLIDDAKMSLEISNASLAKNSEIPDQNCSKNDSNFTYYNSETMPFVLRSSSPQMQSKINDMSDRKLNRIQKRMAVDNELVVKNDILGPKRKRNDKRKINSQNISFSSRNPLAKASMNYNGILSENHINNIVDNNLKSQLKKIDAQSNLDLDDTEHDNSEAISNENMLEDYDEARGGSRSHGRKKSRKNKKMGDFSRSIPMFSDIHENVDSDDTFNDGLNTDSNEQTDCENDNFPATYFKDYDEARGGGHSRGRKKHKKGKSSTFDDFLQDPLKKYKPTTTDLKSSQNLDRLENSVINSNNMMMNNDNEYSQMEMEDYDGDLSTSKETGRNTFQGNSKDSSLLQSQQFNSQNLQKPSQMAIDSRDVLGVPDIVRSERRSRGRKKSKKGKNKDYDFFHSMPFTVDSEDDKVQDSASIDYDEARGGSGYGRGRKKSRKGKHKGGDFLDRIDGTQTSNELEKRSISDEELSKQINEVISTVGKSMKTPKLKANPQSSQSYDDYDDDNGNKETFQNNIGMYFAII